MSTKTPTFVKSLLAGLIAGAVAAVANLAYFFIYKTSMQMEDTGLIVPASTIMASIMPSLFAALGWFGLTRLLPKQANLVFIAVVAILTLLSLSSSFQTTMPDGTQAPEGFAWLSAVMHLIVGLAAILVIPRRAPMA